MNYVFAESWTPEYGNSILSKWPIKKWKVQKIYDDKDFRFFNNLFVSITQNCLMFSLRWGMETQA